MVTSAFGKYGGVGNHVHNLSRQLIRRGHEVTVITRGSMKGLEVSCIDGITVYRVRFLPLYPFHAKLYEFSFTKNFRMLETTFDVVHSHYPLSPVVHTQLPTVVTMHTTGIEQAHQIRLRHLDSLAYKLFFIYIYPIESKILRNADLVTTVSKKVAEELHRYHGVKPDSVVTLGTGVDTNFFAPRKNSEISEGTYIFYCGRLGYRKGLFDLVKSARYISHEHPEVSFVLAGKGPLEKTLERLVRKMGLSKKFHFLGYVEENTLLRYYQNALVCVLPSHYEGLPAVLLEAMACGVPVVATNVGGVSEVVVNGENGLIVPIKHPKAIANAILSLLENNDLRRDMGKAARETVERCYGWDKIACKVLNCYASVAEKAIEVRSIHRSRKIR